MRLAQIAAIFAALACLAAASDPADQLPNPSQEAHARTLFKEIRCVVCQNESIDDSEADVARDLRQAVRGQVAAGRSDRQIKAYLVQRYGEFILLRPTFSPGNALLWLGPFVIVFAGAGVWAVRARRPPAPEAGLTKAEEAKLRELNDF
jgi:cytochrome c-type biogenesis protein CcmH